ncbi:unnamed protein product, partial [Cyprideis torosa]
QPLHSPADVDVSPLCSPLATCEACQRNPACGWCDDGSGTGLGRCLEGNYLAPALGSNSTCFKRLWFFSECPTCQCNGHSYCINETDVCAQPCLDSTEGPHCDTCIPGFHGNPVNGGTCSHELAVDFQFTFNLSKKEDRHFTQINFQNTPPKTDIHVDFAISCSRNASFNITFITDVSEDETSVQNAISCPTTGLSHQLIFSAEDYHLGDPNYNTTFRVYLYDLQPPLIVTVAFSQHPKLDLLQFFITFST